MQWARTVDSAAAAAYLPLAPGVYRFRDQAGRVLYVGRAVSLRRRVLSYWGDLGDRGHLAPMVARIARVEAVICDSAHKADGQAGAERDLARLRGAAPGARAELARAIAAVLGRDRDAVAALGEAVPVARVVAHDRLTLARYVSDSLTYTYTPGHDG